METSKSRSFISGTPAWVLSFIVFVTALIYLFFVGEALEHFTINGINGGDWIIYVSTGVGIAIACFFICREYPRSGWYVPILCNATGILAALIEPTFWITSMWVMFMIGWILSLVASAWGAFMARKEPSAEA
jgi:hypothetical protein